MNCLLYPFSNELSAFVQAFPNYNKAFQITKLAAPLAWKYVADDPDNVLYDFDEALQGVDSVIFADLPQNQFMYRDLVKKMNDSLRKNKHVVCLTPLKTEDKSFLADLAKENDLRFEYAVPDQKKEEYSGSFAPQDCIVIGIGGLFKEIDTFSSLLHLVHKYRTLGYRVAAVSDNKNAVLCGFVPFPTVAFDNMQMADESILYLNDFFNRLQLLYQPDIILTQIPGGMVKYSDACPDNFGVKAYLFSQAVNIDFLILNAPPNIYDAGFYAHFSAISEKRYGCKLNAVGVVNKGVNLFLSEERKRLQYDTVKTEAVLNCVRKLKEKSDEQFFVYDASDVVSYKKLSEYSIQFLSQ